MLPLLSLAFFTTPPAATAVPLDESEPTPPGTGEPTHGCRATLGGCAIAEVTGCASLVEAREAMSMALHDYRERRNADLHNAREESFRNGDRSALLAVVKGIAEMIEARIPIAGGILGSDGKVRPELAREWQALPWGVQMAIAEEIMAAFRARSGDGPRAEGETTTDDPNRTLPLLFVIAEREHGILVNPELAFGEEVMRAISIHFEGAPPAELAAIYPEIADLNALEDHYHVVLSTDASLWPMDLRRTAASLKLLPHARIVVTRSQPGDRRFVTFVIEDNGEVSEYALAVDPDASLDAACIAALNKADYGGIVHGSQLASRWFVLDTDGNELALGFALRRHVADGGRVTLRRKV